MFDWIKFLWFCKNYKNWKLVSKEIMTRAEKQHFLVLAIQWFYRLTLKVMIWVLDSRHCGFIIGHLKIILKIEN